ncbi:hypothetical protein ACS8DM_23615, partial [Escherichia coli]|uniref:hypothetical protein n=1 Tax=Escherichia coli TaxID=562 RepID=UPI003F446A7A
VSIKNDGHYFCRAGGNRPDGLNEPVTLALRNAPIHIFRHRDGASLVTQRYILLPFGDMRHFCVIKDTALNL